MRTESERLPARYYARTNSYGNVVWSDKRDAPGFRMVRGVFGPKHPCRDNPKPTVWSREDQPESDDGLGKLRARDYMASCFPEGDGISFDPPKDRSTEEIVRDIEECLPVKLTVKYP